MDNGVIVSAASAMEVSTNVRIGKLPGAARPVQDFEAIISAEGYFELAITFHQPMPCLPVN